MVCEKARYISDYLDGELEEDSRRIFEEHFKSCPECSRVIEFIKESGKLPKYPASNAVIDVVMNRIQNPGIGELARFYFERYSKLAVPAIALAAIFLILKFSPGKDPGLVKVSFAVPVEATHSVSLVGDFNNWDSSKGQLRRHGRGWHGTFYLKPGRYQYMIVVDDDKWMTDPQSVEYVDDGYGNKNSLIDTRKI